ncbi:MAG: M50 family metallopeptidase [Clostridia bacterium]|nr:M50 family metallopeptidase [Clostridia bacterium]
MKQLRQLLNKLNEFPLTPWLSINIWLIPVVIFSVLENYFSLYICTFSIALLHESAHIVCAKTMGIKISHITLFPFGVSASLSRGYIKSSEKEFLIAFSGPLSNIILFWIFRLSAKFFPLPILGYCADVNLAMCAVNLLPSLPLDGGRMLKSILTSKFGILRSYNFMLKLSRVLIFAIGAVALLLLIATSFNFSLILISVFLFQNLSHEQTLLSHIALREILENNEKINAREFFPTKNFCVKETSRISSILRYLSYDYFIVLHILDKNSQIVRTATETELLTHLTKNGIRARFCDIY